MLEIHGGFILGLFITIGIICMMLMLDDEVLPLKKKYRYQISISTLIIYFILLIDYNKNIKTNIEVLNKDIISLQKYIIIKYLSYII
jgi:uncharacterized membrane protein required for colicin V production